MKVRVINNEDIPFLVAIYRDAIMTLGRGAYHEEQLKVWAGFAEEGEAFRRKVFAGKTLCVEVGGKPVAFGQLHPVDYISLLYCHSGYAKKGYASMILSQLESEAREKGVCNLRVDASVIARPFFEHHGFRVIKPEHVNRGGILFLRYQMEKPLLQNELP